MPDEVELRRVFGRLWEDKETGERLGEDMYGVIHVLPPVVQETRECESDWTRLLIHGYMTKPWPDTNGFHSMENYFQSDLPLIYEVPAGQTAHITSVLAAQSVGSLALIGMFVNDSYVASLPFYREIAHAITTDLPLVGGTSLEIKVWPSNKTSRFAILMGGYLTNG